MIMYMGTRSVLESLLQMKRMMAESTLYGVKVDITNEQIAAIESKIHDELIGFRNRYRESVRYADKYRWHYTDYDRAYAKLVIPYEMTDDEIKEFTCEEWMHWYNPYDDGRDCTGVWFTSGIRCFRCDGKTIIYHFKSCDV